MLGRARHSPSKQRVEPNGQERRFVTPILEDRARRLVTQPIELAHVVRAEPAERWQVVRSREDVHRIDLDDTDLLDELSHGRRWRRETLRCDRERARLFEGQLHDEARGVMM